MAKKDDNRGPYTCDYPTQSGDPCQNIVKNPTARCHLHKNLGEGIQPTEIIDTPEHPDKRTEEAFRKYHRELLEIREKKIEYTVVEGDYYDNRKEVTSKGGDATMNEQESTIDQIIDTATSVFSRVKGFFA